MLSFSFFLKIDELGYMYVNKPRDSVHFVIIHRFNQEQRKKAESEEIIKRQQVAERTLPP
jgi:hypothetical protein